VASRRASERLIIDGRVRVNGVVVRELGTKADPTRDDVRVDGRAIVPQERQRYVVLNKPRGYVTTRSDPEHRPTVLDLLRGVREYIYPVGRLDFDSDGLLLFTNDGDLAARLTHPRHGVARVYRAQVLGVPDSKDLARLSSGVVIEGRRTEPADVRLVTEDGAGSASQSPPAPGAPRRRSRAHPSRPVRSDRRDTPSVTSVLLVTVREGRNRQVRKMCDAIGHPVRRLTRIAIGPLRDAALPIGTWRDLTPREVTRLRQSVQEE
jgi:pseudouridine synthase